MNSDNSFLVVHCTCPDMASAQAIASALVEKRLAACVNLIPGVRSVYLWQNQTEVSEEVLLEIKTQAAAYAALEQQILALHPYQVPEIIALPLVGGSRNYLNWVRENTCVN